MLSTLFIQCVESFVVCILGKMAQDVGMVLKCCGVTSV